MSIGGLNIPAPFTLLFVGMEPQLSDLVKWGTLATGGGLYGPISTANAFVRTASVTAANVGAGTIAANTTFKAAARFAALDTNIAVGGVIGTHNTTATPSTFDQMLIGAGYTFGGTTNATIQKVILYPTAYSDAALQALTT